MPLSSMTGFARADGAWSGQTWIWEAKSVNARGLDIRFRLPPGLDAIELPGRQLVGERFRRGSLSVALQLGPAAARATYRLNTELLHQIAALSRQVKAVIEAEPPRLDGLLALRGVLELVEPAEDEMVRAAREAALLQSLSAALDRLAEMRAGEGKRLAAVLSAQIDEVERLVAAARQTAGARPEAQRARLADQVAALLGAAPGLPEERLTQELALLATRGDIAEELDRLTAHAAAARELLTRGDPAGAGRRFDFLAQEFNREANTLCSKSADGQLTRLGLDLKLVIDRLREQVQNIE